MTEDQLDLFAQPPPELALVHKAEEVTNVYKAKEGSAEYKAACEMLHFIDYVKLNDWQKKVLWPHLCYIRDEILPKAEEAGKLQFELGYIVGALEIEQLRSRSAAREIANKYGITF